MMSILMLGQTDLVLSVSLEVEVMSHNERYQQHLDAAVEQLWSSNDSERNAGVERILEIGSSASDLLLETLVSLTQDQYPRFPKGKEEDGKRAVEEYLWAEREFEEDDNAVDYQVVIAKKNAVSKLAMNARVMRDVVDLLGQLRAEASIPILIKIANRHWAIGITGPEIRSSETEALTRIGKAAIPSLIKNLDETSIRCSGFEPIVYGWRIPTEYDDDDDDGEESIRYKIYLIRLRTLSILSEIGVSDAVQPLEKFLENIKQGPQSPTPTYWTHDSLIRTIEVAISKIQKTGRFRPQDPGAPRLEARPTRSKR
jgi:hypothetical protein